MRSNRVGRNRR